jgi:hypothetical protein
MVKVKKKKKLKRYFVQFRRRKTTVKIEEFPWSFAATYKDWHVGSYFKYL